MRHLRRAHHRPTPREVQLVFVLPGLFGGPLETRTPDPLIKSSPKPTNQAKPNQKFPKFSRHFALSLWVDLVPSADDSRTNSGLQTDFRFAGRRGASVWPQILMLKRVESGMSVTPILFSATATGRYRPGGSLFFPC